MVKLRDLHAGVTLQPLLLLRSFQDGGIDERKRNKDGEGGVCHDSCSTAEHMLQVLSTLFSSPNSGLHTTIPDQLSMWSHSRAKPAQARAA